MQSQTIYDTSPLLNPSTMLGLHPTADRVSNRFFSACSGLTGILFESDLNRFTGATSSKYPLNSNSPIPSRVHRPSEKPSF